MPAYLANVLEKGDRRSPVRSEKGCPRCVCRAEEAMVTPRPALPRLAPGLATVPAVPPPTELQLTLPFTGVRENRVGVPTALCTDSC